MFRGLPAQSAADASTDVRVTAVRRIGRTVLTIGVSQFFLALLFIGILIFFIGVLIFRMSQLILIVDLEFLRSFGVFVGLTLRCLIFTLMFIVSIIIVIFGATRRVLGKYQFLKLARNG